MVHKTCLKHLRIKIDRCPDQQESATPGTPKRGKEGQGQELSIKRRRIATEFSEDIELVPLNPDSIDTLDETEKDEEEEEANFEEEADLFSTTAFIEEEPDEGQERLSKPQILKVADQKSVAFLEKELGLY